MTAAGLAFTAGFGVAGATFHYFGSAAPEPRTELAPPQATAIPVAVPAELTSAALFAQPGQGSSIGTPAIQVAVTADAPTDGPGIWALTNLDQSSSVAEAAPERLLPPKDEVLEVEVEKGDTLIDILQRAGAVDSEAHAAIAALKDVYDPRQLRAGARVSVALASGDEASPLQGLTIPIAFAQELKVDRDEAGGFNARTVELTLDREDVLAGGTISGSLYDSARAAGMPAETIMRFVKLLSWDVDFQRDLKEGDRFEVIYDRLSTPDGRESRYDDIGFARLVNGERDFILYRFEREDGSRAWYDANGKSVRKSLLRTPIDGARLSSGFGMRRHPVLGYSRMHKGTDFAAPTGTPIFAAGDGVIEMRGRNRGYGNYIRIRHNAEYATAYAHMSRFAKQLKVGSKVRQGEVIGYVGTTGLSTGPHLHYEVLHQGAQINPLSVKQNVAEELSGKELARFKAERDRLDALRRQLAAPSQVAQN
ncbi:MAG TPA: peptidoglycan DD-metalloendopeptidase family protein [Geminicoccus sp.]|uniref:peptidoglycan DD-metalloendopeptidase family protein n=1 Tax=Geminicoccus sp. TaxID=2024832 RepID=UPI002C037487|nr:peptidoglycan DD-metalloendopeptidase family protein [Geminicoccus sp.]HWL70202.1 peptidoglycan DD-metalloendopeptidase family protein [Geminicoccus sp.]